MYIMFIQLFVLLVVGYAIRAMLARPFFFAGKTEQIWLEIFLNHNSGCDFVYAWGSQIGVTL